MEKNLIICVLWIVRINAHVWLVGISFCSSWIGITVSSSFLKMEICVENCKGLHCKICRSKLFCMYGVYYYYFYFLRLNLILKLMVADLLLLLHLLFGMHFHSNLDLVIPFLLLNLRSRLGFLKLVMMLSYIE